MVILFLGIFFFFATACAAPQHFISVMGDPLYPQGQQILKTVNPDAPQGGSIVLGALGYFDTFHPIFLHKHCAEGVGHLWATLFQRSEEIGVCYPYLADSVDIQEDKATFHLNSHAVFSNGIPVLPEDVLFSFDLLRKHHFPLPGYYACVERAQKTGPCQVTFFLKKGAAKESVSILAEFPIFSKKYFETVNIEKHPLAIPLGNGPYRIVSFVPGRCVQYEKVPHWWGHRLPIHTGVYNFQKIIYEYFKDPAVLFEAFKGEQIDLFTERLSKNWLYNYDFDAVKQGRILKKEIPHQHPALHPAFIFNTRKPLFQDVRVRRALSLMLNFEAINALLMDNAYQRVSSLFEHTPFAARSLPNAKETALLKKLGAPPETWEHPIEHWTQFKGTMDDRKKAALHFLEEAGWKPHHGVLKNKKGQPFTFVFSLPDTFLERIIRPFMQALGHIGIQMYSHIMNPAQYTKHVQQFDFDMIFGSLSITGDMPGNELLSSLSSDSAQMVGAHNLAGIQHPLIDKQIHAILASQTLEDMRLHAHVLDRIFMAQHYGIPAWYFAKQRLAFWNRFSYPTNASKDGSTIDNWWEITPKQH